MQPPYTLPPPEFVLYLAETARDHTEGRERAWLDRFLRSDPAVQSSLVLAILNRMHSPMAWIYYWAAAARLGAAALARLPRPNWQLDQEMSESGRQETLAERLLWMPNVTSLRGLIGEDPSLVRHRAPGGPLLAVFEYGFENPADLVEIVGLLLDCGCDPNAADRDRRTVLHWLGLRPHRYEAVGVDIAILLLAAGADPLAADVNRETPLDAATRSRCDQLAAVLEAAVLGRGLPSQASIPTRARL